MHNIRADFDQKSINSSSVKYINNYVNFVNESTHGLLIVNKLLENYNLELNKYVDLESYKINNYTNEDLPKNVFEDPDRLFFNKLTPFEWYEKCKLESKFLDPESARSLNNLADKIKVQINIINNLRFELDKVTMDVDLSNRDNLAKVYVQLENAALAFQEFYKVAGQIEKFIAAYYRKNNVTIVDYKSLYDIYGTAKTLVVNIREKETTTYKAVYDQYLINIKTFETSISQNPAFTKLNNQKNTILKNAQSIATTALKFMNNDAVPDQYKLYGRFYYYYNIGMLSKYNRYGTGLASEINTALMNISLDYPLVMELPHIFQVIYPKKLDESPTLVAKEDLIEVFPITLRERKINVNTTKIRADKEIVELLFYDHMIIDGDVVSINFNGDWIIVEAELEKQPQSVKLKLNPEGKNYLILHADNVGSRPPNTTAISYKYRGIKREIILKSDYKQSELIEILID
jgi:FlaG/FlaF family flagellin (archaellin)